MPKSLIRGGALSALVIVCALGVSAGRMAAQSGTLPTPWLTGAIGSPALAGSASLVGDTFTVAGAGNDIWAGADQFHFVRQPLQGDVEVIARVASLQHANDWSKAGVMIRESLARESRHASFLVSGTQGWAFQRRIATGGGTSHLAGPIGGAPGWVRLVREGNLFTAYYSTDGTTWVLVGTDTIAMAATVYVGLAVSSHNVGATATATFTNVTARAFTTGTNQPPTVSLTSPLAGATFTAPATFTLGATASDTDGTVARVDFYQGATLIATDATNPYSATISNLAAGSYQLTARATDSDGVSTTSAPVSVTVTTPTNQPPTVALTSPAAGATFTAPASVIIGASASDTDGTVTQVDFYQGTTLLVSDTSSPYGYTWTSVAAGSYQLTAVARDNGGATRTSTAVSITVGAANNVPPAVSLTSPAAGASFTAPATITLQASASDTDGTVTSVAFYRGTTLIGTDTTSPYSAVWTGATAGSYSLTAVAVDDDAATRTSTAVNITVTGAPNQLPTVSITSPIAGQSFTAPASLTIAATASDSDGTIAGVDFLVGTQMVGSDTTSPYTAAWTNVAAGSYSLTAVARDNAGGTRTSATVAVTVTGTTTAWTNTDVGSPALAGSASLVGDTFTVAGAGNDIWAAADQFHFARQPLQGDVEVIARVASLQHANDWSKAGVMIRESLARESRHASFLVSGTQGWTFQRRIATGGGTAHLGGPIGGAPGWMRLVREGNLFTAHYSTDGTTWVLVGTDTIAMAATVYVGLAVSSHNVGATATATFTNVTARAFTTGTNQPPTVSLTSPSAGATFTAPATFTLGATASDTDGTVARVDFYQGATLIATDATNPYSATISNLAAGSYQLTARATDSDGVSTTSAPVSVTVTTATNQPPTVALTSPAGGATFTAPASVIIGASASDTDGTVTQVDFYQGTTLLVSDTSSPYGYTWTSVAAGSYQLTAVARDNGGATRTSTAVSITVGAANNVPPAVSLTSPAAGASFTAPATITLQASASDTDGTVTSVAFYRGTTLIGTDTTSPYSAVWTGATAGSYSLTAVAVDDDAATRTSTAVNITVTGAPNQLPTVSITSPIAGQSFTAPASLTIAATASDSDGTIVGVDFFVGTQMVGSDTTSPYTAAWTNVAAGSYSLTAVARDNAGGTRTSAAVAVTVTAVGPSPFTLVFGASGDHVANVTSYSVAIYRSIDPVTASPVATRDLGKPAVVSGDITVDISTLITPLPAGSYYAVVRAINPGGTTASAASAMFTR